MDGKIQKVEYERLPHIYFQCGKYSHSKDICPDRMVDTANTDSFGMRTANAFDENSKSNPNFGHWVVVSRKGKNRLTIVKRLCGIPHTINGIILVMNLDLEF